MSITRLQQARQMYAMGQRVAKTLDGSRPGYRGSDYGDEARGTGGYSGSGDTGDFGSEKANVANTKSAETNLGMDSRDRAIANQYKNLPTPTVTVGVDKFDNPIEIKTTYTDKRNRQDLLDALKKFSAAGLISLIKFPSSRITQGTGKDVHMASKNTSVMPPSQLIILLVRA